MKTEEEYYYDEEDDDDNYDFRDFGATGINNKKDNIHSDKKNTDEEIYDNIEYVF